MFNNALVRELALILGLKLFLVWVLWFSFFGSAEKVDPGDLFVNGSANQYYKQR